MTRIYPLFTRRSARAALLFFAFCIPVFTFSANLDDSGCCNDYDYWIKFPKDASANCTSPAADDIEIREGYCDLLAISKKDKKFLVPGSSKCYKIFRTYSVVNWCEYVDGAEPVVVGRDEDCDGKPGDEDIYVIVKTKKGNDPCMYHHYGYYKYTSHYQHVWYDRDANPYNGYPAAGAKSKACDYESNPEGFWKELTGSGYDKKYYRDHCEIASVGYWQYTQMIKVTDTDAPQIAYKTPDAFCSYSSDKKNDCPASVSLDFSVQEDCAPGDVTVKAYLDKDRDGNTDGEVTAGLTGKYPDFQWTGILPLGKHYLKVVADDGCGNLGVAKIPVEVEDCAGPSPICLNGLAIKLMPVIPAADVDEDGDTDEGMMTIWASDFIASATYDCSGPVKYSVNRDGEAPDENRTGITFTCDDDPVALVEIHAWDAAGNNDYCVTYVQVQANDGLCPAPAAAGGLENEADDVSEFTGFGMLSGVVATEQEIPVSGVMIHRMSQDTAHQISGISGEYAFEEAALGARYLIEPEADGEWLAGVTISDLFLLKKYLMGLAELDSPYKMLAADLDTSRTITQNDLDLLWSLFLYQATELEYSNSWQFVPKNYTFPDTTNPWVEEVPHNILIDTMQAPMTELSFVALKMGDLDGSFAPPGEPRSSAGQLTFQVPDMGLKAGETYRLPFTVRDPGHLEAFQATLAFDPGKLEFIGSSSGMSDRQNLGLQDLQDGRLHMAWHRPVGSAFGPNSGDQLFSLEFRAVTDSRLSAELKLSSRGLKALAFGIDAEPYELHLEFLPWSSPAAGFVVHQNSPNPFRNKTLIRYYLPEASAVNLRLTDAGGRLLREIRTDGHAGENTLPVARQTLAPGIVFYTLTAGEHSVTRKMLVVD